MNTYEPSHVEVLENVRVSLQGYRGFTHVIQTHDVSHAVSLVETASGVCDCICCQLNSLARLFVTTVPIMVSTPSSLHTRVANVTKSIVCPS